MSLDKLYRDEALKYQRVRLWGEVILTQPVSYFVISGVIFLFLLLAGIFLFSQSYARKEAVIGYLVPDSGLSKVFATQGGVIEQMNVDIGQSVKKGELIAVIKQDNLVYNGKSAPFELIQSLKREIEQVNFRHKQTFTREKAEELKINAQIQGMDIELEQLSLEKSYQVEAIALADKQFENVRNLTGKGYVSERIADDAKKSAIKAKQALISLKRLHSGTESSIRDMQASLNILSLRFDEQRSILLERKESLNKQLRSVEHSRGHIVVATIDGVISSILASKGNQLATGAPLVVITPEDTNLHARLLVPSRAAGLISIGQSAKIQYDAFPFQRFGIFTGTITSVSQSIVTPGEVVTPIPINESYYTVDLVLDSQTILVKGENVSLKTGMSLKADIVLESRTLIQWLFNPLFSVTEKI